MRGLRGLAHSTKGYLVPAGRFVHGLQAAYPNIRVQHRQTRSRLLHVSQATNSSQAVQEQQVGSFNEQPFEPTGRLILIDTHALMFRFHHSYGKLLQSETGEKTSISYGVMKTLLDLLETVNPPLTHLAVIMDAPGKNFRHELFKQYKAHRPPFPVEIKEAIPQLEELLRSLRIKLIRESGVEADDIIGTLATRAVDEGYQVAIVSPDKDFFQLLRPNLTLLRTPKRDSPRSNLFGGQRLYTGVDFEDEWNIKPDQWRDVLALWGDAADNVPGVAGIGEKGALELLREFGTLENILANVPQIKKKRQRTPFEKEVAAEVARFSQDLVTIITDLETPGAQVRLEEFEMTPLREDEKTEAIASMQKIGFKTLIERWKRIWARQ